MKAILQYNHVSDATVVFEKQQVLTARSTIPEPK